MTLKELVFTEGHRVVLLHIDDGHAVYDVVDAARHHLFTFDVPPEDLRGGCFQVEDTPKVFMRWIRQSLKVYDDQQAMIAQAKKDWEEGKQG